MAAPTNFEGSYEVINGELEDVSVSQNSDVVKKSDALYTDMTERQLNLWRD